MKVVGMGDLKIDMPNRSKTTMMMFKNAIHAPQMAFTLISISRLDKASYQVTFKKGMCTIFILKGQVIAMIPHSDGLYGIIGKHDKDGGVAAVASGKMSISKAHRKLGHLAYGAVTHAISKGYIAGIDLDTNSKSEFCDACAKVKAARQPFLKESNTRATKYGKCVHWDLWGPATMKSLNGYLYVAARIDDATREMKLYFQTKKSQTVDSYKLDEAYIKT